jgi:hypothetical protein
MTALAVWWVVFLSGIVLGVVAAPITDQSPEGVLLLAGGVATAAALARALAPPE